MNDETMDRDLSRREFIRRAAAGTAALGVSSLAADAAEGEKSKLPMRTLGETGVKVSLLGFGGGSQFLMAAQGGNDGEALAMLERAIAAGITYFDTASSYGRDRQSEKTYGKVLPKYRKQIFLATKSGDRTYDGLMRSVEESLKNLKTDRLDLMQMHDVGPRDDPSKWDKPDGALTALRKLKDQKVVRFIGFTGHQKAEVHKNVIETHDFDTVLMALNAAEHKPFRELPLPAAVKKKMGIIGMKITRGLVGAGAGKASVKELLSYAWDLPIATTIIGMQNRAMLEENLRVVMDYKPGKVNAVALTDRLAPHVTAEQLGWAMPGYEDRSV